MMDHTAPRLDVRATVADVLRLHPAAAPVFAAFGVDACCGGDRTVAGAAREDGVNLTALLLALELAAEGGCDGPACACPCAAPCRSAAR